METKALASPAPPAEPETSAPAPRTKKSKNQPDPEWRPRRSKYSPNSRLALSYHQRTCSICKHPLRSNIETAYVQWRSARLIAQEFNLGSRHTVYRHAYALGLFAERNRNLRFALSHIIEQAECVDVTADSVIGAVRAFARLNDQGEWTEPPSTHVVIARVEPRHPVEHVLPLTSPDLPAPALPAQPAPMEACVPQKALRALSSGSESAHSDRDNSKTENDLTP